MKREYDTAPNRKYKTKVAVEMDLRNSLPELYLLMKTRNSLSSLALDLSSSRVSTFLNVALSGSKGPLRK